MPDEIESLKKELKEANQTISHLRSVIQDRAGYDPINDEKKKFLILEFQMELIDQMIEFSRLQLESEKNPQNEEQKIKEHTFNEWMRYFRMWASW